MAEDAAWCAMGDPLGVVGCNSDGGSSWLAQVKSEDELDAALSAIEGLFAQVEEEWDNDWSDLEDGLWISQDAWDDAKPNPLGFGTWRPALCKREDGYSKV